MSSSPVFVKRGREDDEVSPTKRTRTRGDFDLQLRAVMPSSSTNGFTQFANQAPQQQQQGFHFQQHHQQQAGVNAGVFNNGTGSDMNMDEDMNVAQPAQQQQQQQQQTSSFGINGIGLPWASASHVADQFSSYSNVSSAPSTMPNTPYDEIEFQLDDDDDLYGDNTYARPPPCFPSPTEYNQTYTDAQGVTRMFPAPGASDSMDDPHAFATYVLSHGLNKPQQTEAPQPSANGYGWDVPSQNFGGMSSHMV
ncbi:hypothetical protein OIO90_004643 [Microbotryomycetes sp. JL221]|nr:hypothetical protein OIO90_004643 [Microbotryomycetes sp. JL221]